MIFKSEQKEWKYNPTRFQNSIYQFSSKRYFKCTLFLFCCYKIRLNIEQVLLFGLGTLFSFMLYYVHKTFKYYSGSCRVRKNNTNTVLCRVIFSWESQAELTFRTCVLVHKRSFWFCINICTNCFITSLIDLYFGRMCNILSTFMMI